MSLPNIRGVHPDLLKERFESHFDPEEVTNILDGGIKNTEQRRAFENVLLQRIQVSLAWPKVWLLVPLSGRAYI